jgi:hypothetical protein
MDQGSDSVLFPSGGSEIRVMNGGPLQGSVKPCLMLFDEYLGRHQGKKTWL